MAVKKSISRISSAAFILVFILTISPLQVVHAAGVMYAKPVASGTGVCSSWANACTLQTALSNAVSGDEIWVMAGTYKPTAGTDRTATFQLKQDVAVYGGFADTETSRAQRNPAANVTILSGDIDNNDSQTPIITDITTVTGNDTNSYHVVTSDFAENAILDGFTITAGYANGNPNDDTDPTDYGGGMYMRADMALANITFMGNSTDLGGGGGGGLYNLGGSTLTNIVFNGNESTHGGGIYNVSEPTLVNVTFSNNIARGNGGGMYNISSAPILTNVTFNNNSAGNSGGGIFNVNASPVITNATFSDNTAEYDGGAIEDYHSSSPTLTNITFFGNSAQGDGGAMNCDTGGNSSHSYAGYPLFTNVTFEGNTAGDLGGAINSTGGIFDDFIATIRDSILWGNTSWDKDNYSIPLSELDMSDSVVETTEFGIGTNIIETDPKLGTLGNYGGFTQTIPLLAGSSAIDTGNNTTCFSTDQRGVTRPQSTNCDIGAYEVDTTAPSLNSINRLNPSPSSLTNVQFTVIFSEAITGVDINDFSLTTSGVSGATVSAVSGSGSVYTVTVNVGSGNGTIRLDVPTGATITDLALNPLAGLPYTNGQTYTIIKQFPMFLPLIIRLTPE